MKKLSACLLGVLLVSPAVSHAADAPRPSSLNIVFFTADDMNHDSAGCYGCPIKEANGNTRFDRKTVKAAGDGEVAVELNVPAAAKGKAVRFAAFVGEDFARTPRHILSGPVKVGE